MKMGMLAGRGTEGAGVGGQLIVGREDLTDLSWAFPTSSALMLISQMHVLYKCGKSRLANGIRFIAKNGRYNKVIVYQTQMYYFLFISHHLN